MTLTDDKLSEARFFYHKMYEAYNSDNPEFTYYMNAFVSAARSATLVMEKEYSHIEGFKEWWSSNEEKKTPAFQDFNILRTIAIHHRMIHRSGPVWSATFNFGDGLDSKDGVVQAGFNFSGDKPIAKVYITDEKGNKKEVSGIAGEVVQDFSVTEYHEDKKSEVKIDKFLQTSQKYLESLEKIILECETKFKQ